MSKKESALELAKLMDKGVRVKLAGGREGALSDIKASGNTAFGPWLVVSPRSAWLPGLNVSCWACSERRAEGL